MRPGTWWIASKKDPRWSAHGQGDVGMFATPTEAKAKLAELTKIYGDPPDDLEFGYMKD